MSREMKLGIKFFDKGDDMQAMDRFMEVLTRGDPAERSMANEYINLISRRMNGNERAPERPVSTRPNETVVERADGQPAAPAARAAASGPEIVVEREAGAV